MQCRNSVFVFNDKLHMVLLPSYCRSSMREFVHSISRVCIESRNLESSQEARAALDFACPDLNVVNISILL